MKTIAIYLPQFHEVEENNQWWGKGFTDWITVKNAHPLYTEHRQPRVPLNKNYYNLLDHDIMKWQAELAKTHKVSGFCFYHYWFKDGKKILERPAENLLKWKDIDMPFCFSWANQTWARTWTNFSNRNAWTGADFEKGKEGEKDDGILLRQSYGGKREWKEHFDYLLPFFKDSRYIQYDGKPVFLIYKPEFMFCLDNMMEYWKELAVENGLNGICVITVRNNSRQWSQADYWLMQELDYSFMPRVNRKEDEVWQIEYKDAWEDVLKRAYADGDDNIFYGGFIDVDDTPRRGNRGVSIKDASPAIFEKYYKKLAELAAVKNRDLIFVNAWNEWGEGAYLEPDEDFKYGYLEAVKRVMDYIDQTDAAYLQLDVKYIDLPEKGTTLIDERIYRKKEKYYHLLNKWVENREKNKKIDQVLVSMQIKNIAIYGMGDFGKHLVKELENSMVNIQLCFDKTTDFLYMENPSKYIQNHYVDLDAVIVTPFLEYKEIRLFLKDYFSVPIISLEELISECEIL